MDIQQSTITREEVFARQIDNILAQQVGDEFVILDASTAEYYRLNEIAAKVWDLLHEGKSLKTVLHSLLDEYDVPEERLTNDLTSLFNDLQSRGLVEFYVAQAS